MSLSTQSSRSGSGGGAPLSIRRLAPSIGAEILDVDLSQPLAKATAAAVHRAWNDHNILLFRDQELSETAEIRFAENFGPIAKPAIVTATMAGHAPGIMLISNIRENGQPIGELPDGEMWFHADQCYIEKPCAGSMLFAVEVPSRGGNTLFANLYAAYEALPASVKTRIAGLKAVHIYDYKLNLRKRDDNVDDEVLKNAKRFAHPIVRTHPETGRRRLFVNRLMTAYIEGIPAAESEALLATLIEQTERPEFIYEHAWRKGDLMMWDNRCTLHARTDFNPAERRLLRRVTIEGDRPH